MDKYREGKVKTTPARGVKSAETPCLQAVGADPPLLVLAGRCLGDGVPFA